jgi:hypothetical protein
MVVNKQAVVAATVAANAGVQHCNRARARVVSQFAPPDVCDPLVGSCQIMEPDEDHVGQSRSSRAVGGRGQLLPTSARLALHLPLPHHVTLRRCIFISSQCCLIERVTRLLLEHSATKERL